MIRALATVLLLPVALAMPAAGQTPPTPAKTTTRATVLAPRPTPVAAHQPLDLSVTPPVASGYTPAPMPNLDVASPSAAAKVGPEFSGSLFGARDASSVANGYVDGSQNSAELEHRSRGLGGFAPTVGFKIPFTYANQQLQ